MLTIDLAPIEVSAIEARDTDLILRLPNQPIHSSTDQGGEDKSKSCSCAFIIKNGQIEVQHCAIPFESVEWELSYPGGSSSYFLPQGFEAVGPIRLEFYECTDAYREKPPFLVLVGKHFALEVMDAPSPPKGAYSS